MAQCPIPVAKKIEAHQGTISTGGPTIQGEKSAVLAKHIVIVEDKNGLTSEKTSNENGSFFFNDSDLVAGFRCRIGDLILIRQKSATCEASDAAETEVVF